MALVPFTGTTNITTLRANFDDATAQIAANALLGQCDFEIILGSIVTLNVGDALRDTSVAFTPVDDAQLRAIVVNGTVAGAGVKVTVAVAVDNGDATWLLNTAVSVQSNASGGAGALGIRRTYTATTGTTLRLLAGVRYRLAVSCTGGAMTNVSAAVQMRSRRRRA